MVASLLRVLSSGIQDERLAFQPTLYPFVRVWNKSGRFTTQWVRLDFDNVPAFGQTGYVRLVRKGHLITRLYLVAEMPDIWSAQRRASVANGGATAWPRFGWTNSLGHALVERLTMDIGGSRVESMDGQLMEVLDEFYTPMEKVGAANEGLRRKDAGFTDQTWGWPPTSEAGEAMVGVQQGYKERVVVPLPFWFSRGDRGCALPIDAIGADEVRCSVSFRGVSGLYVTGTQRRELAGEAEGSALWPLPGSRFYTADPVLNPGVLGSPLADGEGVIQMPDGAGLGLGECYVMAEYVYLDQNEANRFRLADLQVPVVQHYTMAPFDTRGLRDARIPLQVPNPARAVMFFCQPWEAGAYNAHFLATREMTGTVNTFPDGSMYPWWPDAVGGSSSSSSSSSGLAVAMRGGFALSDSEPVAGYALEYQGGLVRYRTEAPSLFRSVIPSYEMRKAPWVNRYYYYLPFGVQNGWTPWSQPQGEANLDKMTRKELVLQFRPRYGNTSGLEVGRFQVRVYAETYNMLRVFGRRAGMLFAY